VSDLPFVSFVGAGPGEADLITLKGLRRLRDAAVIVHDRLIAPELLAGELRARPPVLLVHGTEDPLVPFESMASAEAALRQAGVPVETLACPGIEHSIDPEGLERGGRFLRGAYGDGSAILSLKSFTGSVVVAKQVSPSGGR